MGIKGFSKTFVPRVIKQINLNGRTGAFDASVILYQSCLGMPSIKGLTDSTGSSTIHINVIIARVLNFIKSSVGQVWVFDYHEHNYTSPDKEIELAKRRKRKTDAKKKIIDLKKKQDEKKTSKKSKPKYEDLFTDSDDSDDAENNDAIIEKKINQQEKITFTMDEQIVNDCKFILDCFDICWCVSPKGVEAEQVCAELTTTDDLDFVCDFVYSTDVDTLLYGATQLVRSVKSNGKKVLQLYDLDTLLSDAKINQDELIKVGVILGCDHADKTPGVGPKTVLKKFKNIDLTKDQLAAIPVFNKHVDMTSIKFHNKFGEVEVSSDEIKIKKLLDWIELKNFNRDRIKKQIMKANSDLII
jgi:hypothetical protein